MKAVNSASKLDPKAEIAAAAAADNDNGGGRSDEPVETTAEKTQSSTKSWPTKLQDRTVVSMSSFDMAILAASTATAGVSADALNQVQVEPHRPINDLSSVALQSATTTTAATARKEINNDADDEDEDGGDGDDGGDGKKSSASNTSKQNTKRSTPVHQQHQHHSRQTSSPPHLVNNNNSNQVIPNGPNAAGGITNNQLFFASSSQTKTYTIEYSFKRIKPAYLFDTKDFFEYTRLFILFFLNMFVYLPAICLIAAVSMPYKFILRLFYKILHMCHLTRTSYMSPDKLPEFLNPIELFWLYNSNLHENDASLPTTTAATAAAASSSESLAGGAFHSKNACLFLFDGCVSKNKLRDLIKNRIVESAVNVNKYERFTQRVLNLRSLGFVWIRCETFDIDEHIVEIDAGVEFESSEDMQSYLSNLIGRHKFDMSRPLWSLYYKQTVNSKSERSSLALFVFHQSFSDGVSLMRLFLRGLVDNRTQLDVKPRFAYPVLHRTRLKQFFFCWSGFFYALLQLVCCCASSASKNETTHMRRRSGAVQQQSSPSILVWSEAFDLMQLNKLKLITRSKMNDFLVSVVAGIVRHYLQHKGINNPNNLKCLMPIDLRSNKYPVKLSARKLALCSFELPIKVEGCVPRLWATKCATHEFKNSSEFLYTNFIIKSMFRLFPNRFAFRCIRRLLANHACVVSSIGCGSDSSLATVSVANQNIKNIIYFYPTVANVAVSFSLITYGDEVRLAMVADTGVINNPEFITKQFIKQLKILNDLLGNRRIPGEIKRGARPPADFDHLYAHPLIDATQMDDYVVSDMQLKMTQIQQEMQQLTESMEKLDPSASDFSKRRQVIMIKSEKLRKEFSRMLADMRSRSREISQAIPSDDEDELEPDERVRLRSASVASHISSNSRRLLRDSHSEHSNADRPMSSRKASLAQNSRQGSLSYSSAHSLSREFSHGHQSRANSNVNLHAIQPPNNHIISMSIEHETQRSSSRHN